MPYPAELLNDDEQIVLDLRPHWWFIVPRLALLVVMVAFGLVVLANDWPGPVMALVAVAVLVALVYFIFRYIRWASTVLVLTNDRLIYRAGVFTRHGVEIPLERINTVFLRQSVFERLMGSGDLSLESAGEQGRQNFSDIRRPLQVQSEIYRQMDRNEGRHRDLAGSDDVAGQIIQLDRLRQQGLLTDAEFQSKKADLLRRM